MRKYIERLPRELKDLIYLAGDIAAHHKIPAYLVGGFVRDLILGAGNLDLDIVVEGGGIKFAEEFARQLQAKLIRHTRFGTATLILRPNLKIDIATARKEFYPKPASLPVVSFGSLKDDLIRRDFTVNAMAISISRNDLGALIDIFGGKNDLKSKKIRILHNLSFIDDPIRILRAIRFEKRYDFRIESGTLQKIKEAVKLKMLEQVQPQRLREELILLLKEEQPLKQIKRMQELTGLGFISPQLSLSAENCRLLSYAEAQVKWFRHRYAQRRQLDTWLIYFMGLLDSLDTGKVKSACRRFVFRRGEEKRILAYKKNSAKLIRQLSRDNLKPAKIFRLLEYLSYEVILLVKAKSKNRNVERYIEDFFEIYHGICLYITGDDLYGLGIEPGPYYQKIFTKALNAKLNGLVKTQEEELALIKRLITNRNGADLNVKAREGCAGIERRS